MIKIMFEKQGAYFVFAIDNKKIDATMGIYTFPYQPSDFKKVNKQILLSRNKLPAWFARLFELTEAEQKEYDEAKDDEALKQIILKDAKREGAKLIDIKEE